MSQAKFYSRQIILKDIGESGQKKINNNKVLIIGAGGLGHPAATYLCAAGIGQLTIVDDDLVDISNFNRQVYFSMADEGKLKAEILSKHLRNQNPYIEINSIQERLTVKNAEEVISNHDVILDCSDNFATTFLIHDCCWFLKKDLIQASLYQYEGQLQSFHYSNDNTEGCLRCLWENIPEAACTQNCAEAGIIGAVAGTLGSLQAMQAIKMMLNLGNELTNITMTLDLISMESRKLKWNKHQDCGLCQAELTLKDILAKHNNKIIDYELEGLNHKDMVYVDIREKREINFNDDYAKPYRDQILFMPLSESENSIMTLDKNKNYLIICQKGMRSQSLVQKLRDKKCHNYFSLKGGLSRARY